VKAFGSTIKSLYRFHSAPGTLELGTPPQKAARAFCLLTKRQVCSGASRQISKFLKITFESTETSACARTIPFIHAKNMMPLKKSGRGLTVIIAFLLFRKTLIEDGFTDELAESQSGDTGSSRIRCPLCHWEPQASSRWYCGNSGYPEYYSQGCGTCWNTFDTRGLCPGCNHQWRWTACLSCSEWSLHEAWYTDEIDKS